jgi:hypothetical protein
MPAKSSRTRDEALAELRVESVEGASGTNLERAFRRCPGPAVQVDVPTVLRVSALALR